MRLYLLDKQVLRIENNASQFLNGLSSNSLDQPQNALLNIHGRIIATFDQLKIDDNTILIVVDPFFIEEVISHLSRYALLSKSKVEKQAYNVYFDLDNTLPVEKGDFTILQKQGRLVLTNKTFPAKVTEDEFKLFRVTHQIPRMGVDYRQDEFLLNINETDFVSFTKGCFLGQEPVSKVHNRSKPTRQLAVKYEDECTPDQKDKMTSKVVDPQNGRTKGFVFVSNT